jgi:hypothetical protein
MAEGCVEVIAVGSWIGTGTGTGGELNKYGDADEAAEKKGGAGGATEGKKGAGGAAAVQANCIWLMFGTIVTLNFLRKSMPSDQSQWFAKNWMSLEAGAV